MCNWDQTTYSYLLATGDGAHFGREITHDRTRKTLRPSSLLLQCHEVRKPCDGMTTSRDHIPAFGGNLVRGLIWEVWPEFLHWIRKIDLEICHFSLFYIYLKITLTWKVSFFLGEVFRPSWFDVLRFPWSTEPSGGDRSVVVCWGNRI